MNKQYKKEKFESRAECFEWCADNKPIYRIKGLVDNSEDITMIEVNEWWKQWHKAIEIVPEKRLIEVWVSIYEDGEIFPYDSEELATQRKDGDCIGTVKLSKEIIIVNGKVVKDEN